MKCYVPSCRRDGVIVIRDLNIPDGGVCWLCAECDAKLREPPKPSELEAEIGQFFDCAMDRWIDELHREASIMGSAKRRPFKP